jgi:hypothetical protein
MWRTREISAIVYGALQIANTVTSALTPPFLKFSLVSYVGLLDIACWLACDGGASYLLLPARRALALAV